MLQLLATGYLNHSQVSTDDLKSDFENSDKLSGQAKINYMLSSIRDSEGKNKMYGQDAVNQFATLADETQKVLAEKHPNGIVTVYRGVKGDYANNLRNSLKKNKIVSIKVRRVDSWSANEQVARKFAGDSGVVIKQNIPIKNIVFSYEGPTGSWLNEYYEDEHLWLHDSDQMNVRQEDIL